MDHLPPRHPKLRFVPNEGEEKKRTDKNNWRWNMGKGLKNAGVTATTATSWRNLASSCMSTMRCHTQATNRSIKNKVREM